MISYIRGEVAYMEQDKAVIDVNGVGYGIYMPTRVLNHLQTGQQVIVYTYLSVREDAMLLFGFLDLDDLAMFKLLLAVNGIGPKAAIGVLSSLSADDLRFAVLADDIKTISTAPGIGKKTAQKMVLELKDKLSLEETFEHAMSAAKTSEVTGAAASTNKSDAIEILQQWGYTATDALKAVNKLENIDSLSVEDILQQTLKLMR